MVFIAPFIGTTPPAEMLGAAASATTGDISLLIGDISRIIGAALPDTAIAEPVNAAESTDRREASRASRRSLRGALIRHLPQVSQPDNNSLCA
jgi:hypothetical protein